MVGAVALPGQGHVLVTGARRSRSRALAPREDGPLRIVVSRTRPPPEAKRVAARLDAQLVPMGSAGAKTAAVLQGSVDAYVHSGGQYEWDSAAPVAVAHAYGAYAARLDGSTLLYNQPDPWLPDLVVCRPELSGEILDALRPVKGVTPGEGCGPRRPPRGRPRAARPAPPTRSSTAPGDGTVRCTYPSATPRPSAGDHAEEVTEPTTLPSKTISDPGAMRTGT